MGDNASTDGSVVLTRGEYLWPQPFGRDVNCGFCMPNNVPTRKAKVGYLAFLNGDTFVERGWLKEEVLRRYAEGMKNMNRSSGDSPHDKKDDIKVKQNNAGELEFCKP